MKISRCALLCALLLAACAQSGEPFARYAPIPAGKTRLYVYVEPLRLSAFAPSLDLVLDGRPLSTVRSGGYVAVTLVPGEHLLVADPSLNLTGSWTQITRTLELLPDEPLICGYFPGATERRGRLRCGPETDRHEQMLQCRLAPLDPDAAWQP